MKNLLVTNCPLKRDPIKVSYKHRTKMKTLRRVQEFNRRHGVVVRAPASQSVDLGFNPLAESYQKTLKNGIQNFPAWLSTFKGGCGEQAGKFACCVLGQGI